MAAKIPCPSFHGLDLGPICRNWDQDKNGNNVRMKQRAAAMNALIKATNHIKGRCPRTLFTHAFSEATLPGSGSDPLLRWYYNESIVNARRQLWRISYMVPTDVPSGDIYFQRESDTASQSSKHQTYDGNTDFPAAMQFEQFVYDRGATASALTQDGVSMFEDARPMGIVVQEEPLKYLDPQHHDMVMGNARRGTPVLANLAEEIRSEFHDTRTANLPLVFNYAAQAAAGSYATPASSSISGLVITSSSLVNVFDQTFTSRTTASPGCFAHVLYGGKGNRTKDAGRQIAIVCYAYARVTGGDATIRFQGPNTWSNNYEELTISATSPTIVAYSSKFYLDASSDYDDATLAMNKIDVLAKKNSGGTLYIYGLRAWPVWAL